MLFQNWGSIFKILGNMFSYAPYISIQQFSCPTEGDNDFWLVETSWRPWNNIQKAQNPKGFF